MSTLIAVYSGTQCIGRCDAHCYDAVHPHCDCICGGKNHGVGKKKAEGNTLEYCEQWIERYCKEKNIQGGVGEVNPDLFQMKLF
jgi:hypothetical protein